MLFVKPKKACVFSRDGFEAEIGEGEPLLETKPYFMAFTSKPMPPTAKSESHRDQDRMILRFCNNGVLPIA